MARAVGVHLSPSVIHAPDEDVKGDAVEGEADGDIPDAVEVDGDFHDDLLVMRRESLVGL